MRIAKPMASVLAGCVMLLSANGAAAQDWPQWRGPNRDNKVAGFTAPKEWPKALTQKWKVTVGDGVASPVLAGDKIYTFYRQGGEEVVYCLDANTGKEVWKDKYAAQAVTKPATGRNNEFVGTRSSPAVAEGKVCTLGVAGVVSCLDAGTGKVIWRKDTKSRPRFFTSSSPVIVDGMCIAHVGTDGNGELTAFDLATGEAKWKWAADGPSYGSPVLMTVAGKKQIVVLTEKNLVGVGLADGKLLWQVPLSVGRYQTATPIADGAAAICSGTAFTVEKQGDGFAAKELWKGQAPHQYNTPVLKDGLLFGLSGTGGNTKLFCQDAKTGKVHWTDTTTRGECGAVLDAGSVLFALSSNAELLAFKPSSKGYEELAKYKVADSPTWGVPIIAGNRVIVKDRDAVILWTLD